MGAYNSLDAQPPFPKGWTIQSNRKGVVVVHDVRVYSDKWWAGTLLNKDGSVKQQQFIFAKKDYFESEGAACNALASEYQMRIEKTTKQLAGWKDTHNKLIGQRNLANAKQENRFHGP